LSIVTKSVLPPRERVDTGGWLAKELYKLTSTQGVGVVLSGEQISPSVLKHLLHHLRKKNLWERSIEVMDWAQYKRNKLQTPTAKHYTIVISACRDAGELQAAVKVFDMMKRAGVTPDVVTYSTLISACERADDWERACVIFDRMRLDDLAPTAITYTSLISACARGGEVELAERYFQQMCEDGIEPNTFTYTTLISAHSEGGDCKHALAIYDEMKAKRLGISQHTCSALISACRKANQLDKALEIFAEMKASGAVGDVYTYSALISVYESMGDWENALATYCEMRELNIAPSIVTYSSLISAFEKGNQWEHAMEAFADMNTRKLRANVITFSALLSALGKGGQLDRALGIFEWMEVSKVEPDLIAYSTMLGICAKHGAWPAASKILRQMRRRSKLQPSQLTYNLLLDQLWMGGQHRDAASMLVGALADGAYAPAHLVLDADLSCAATSPASGAAEDQLAAAKWSLQLDLHNTSIGAAMARTAVFFLELREKVIDIEEGAEVPSRVVLITGKGLHSTEKGRSPVRATIDDWLHDLKSPFRRDLENEGRLQCSGAEVVHWLRELKTSDLLAPGDGSLGCGFLDREAEEDVGDSNTGLHKSTIDEGRISKSALRRLDDRS